MRENHAYPPTSGPNMKSEGVIPKFSGILANQEQNEYTQFSKITRNFPKKSLFFRAKRNSLEFRQFSKTLIYPQKRHNFKAGKQRFANTKF